MRREPRIARRRSPRALPSTVEEIVTELARVPRPDVARDRDESLAILDRLIRGARAACANRPEQGESTYPFVSAEFEVAIENVDRASVSQLRSTVKAIIDVVWGVGHGTEKRPRGPSLPKRVGFHAWLVGGRQRDSQPRVPAIWEKLVGSMTPEDIVVRIAAMGDPYRSAEPFDAEQTLARLIRDSRRVVSPRHARQRARTYAHETPGYMSEMLRIERAPGNDVRRFARAVVDVLWGVGSGSSRRDPRRLDFDKE